MNDPRRELAALRDRIENPDHDDARAIDEPTCVWCQQALSPDAIDDVEARENRFGESAARADDELADTVAEFPEGFAEHPELRAAVLNE